MTPDTKCSCCKKWGFVIRRGALVCPFCDNLADWPKRSSEDEK